MKIDVVPSAKLSPLLLRFSKSLLKLSTSFQNPDGSKTFHAGDGHFPAFKAAVISKSSLSMFDSPFLRAEQRARGHGTDRR